MVKVVNKREVGGFKTAVQFDVKDHVGQHIEGIFKGSTPIESKKFKGVINNLYFIEEDDGTLYSFFGGTTLDRRLAEFVDGDWVSITYKGMTKNPKSGNSFHDYTVIKGDVVDEEEEPVKATKATKRQPAQEEEEDDDVPF